MVSGDEQRIMITRKFLVTFLSVCITVVLFPLFETNVSATSGNWTDSGTMATSFSTIDTNTITITSEAELALLANNVNTGVSTYTGYTITLDRDLDLAEHYWVAIGTSSTYYFKGIFDGGRYSIKGLYINNTASNQGLFGYVSGGTIKNLSVQGTLVSTGSYIGGIAGYLVSSSYIYNCYSNVNISGGTYVGGIAGYTASSSIINCISCCTLNGTTIGGILGRKGVGGSVSYNYWLYGTATNACGSGSATYSYSFTLSGTIGTLSNIASYTVGSTTININGDLLTALTAWVSTNGTATYKTWRNADSTSENGGCPVFQEIYSVAISWGDFSCTCTQVWNTETCEYTYSWVNSLSSMSIYNSSDAMISASLAYTPNEVGAGTIGIFNHSLYGDFSSLQLEKGTEISGIKLNISGTPTAENIAWDNTTIGTATITIAKGGN